MALHTERFNHILSSLGDDARLTASLPEDGENYEHSYQAKIIRTFSLLETGSDLSFFDSKSSITPQNPKPRTVKTPLAFFIFPTIRLLSRKSANYFGKNKIFSKNFSSLINEGTRQQPSPFYKSRDCAKGGTILKKLTKRAARAPMN